MSEERDNAIAALKHSIGGIDPVLDASVAYANGIREVQKTTHAQGQVMSAALENNAALWELKKKLERDKKSLAGQVHVLSHNVRKLERELAESREAHAKLAANGGDKWRTLYEECRKTLTLYTSDAMDLPELEERLAKMKEQNRELAAQGVKAPPLPDRAVIDRHMAEQGLDERGEHQTMPNGLDSL
jgi:predicted RNase H-like nuclease (RuvC/YqgF family)